MNSIKWERDGTGGIVKTKTKRSSLGRKGRLENLTKCGGKRGGDEKCFMFIGKENGGNPHLYESELFWGRYGKKGQKKN